MRAISEQVSLLESPAVVMPVGLPGTGKTTTIEEIVEDLGSELVTVISTDNIRDELEGVGEREATYDQNLNERVFREAQDRIKAALILGGIVILDSTGLSTKPESDFRPKAVQGYRELGAVTVAALVFNVPLEVAKARNETRGAEKKGYVKPADINNMEAYRRAHPLSPEAPGEFDVVINVPYVETEAKTDRKLPA